MREVLDYCTGGTQRSVPAGTTFIHEGGTTGHLFVLIEGRLEVVKGDTVVANITEPDGFLVLGAAETVVGLTDVFKPFPERRGLYRPNGARATPAKIPAAGAAAPKVAAMAGR